MSPSAPLSFSVANSPKRVTPLTVSDKAKLFSAEAVKSANETVAELFKKGLDVLVETRNANHVAEIIEKLEQAGFSTRRMSSRSGEG